MTVVKISKFYFKIHAYSGRCLHQYNEDDVFSEVLIVNLLFSNYKFRSIHVVLKQKTKKLKLSSLY